MSPECPHTDRRLKHLEAVYPPLVILSLCLAAYAVCMGSTARHLSSSSPLINPVLSWWRNIPTVFSRDFTIHTEGRYRPLAYAIVALVRTWTAANDAPVWRMLLVLIHAGNAYMVFLVSRKVVKGRPAALFAAIIFALHPLGSIVVNDPVNIHLLLGTSFFLGASVAYLAWRASGRGSHLLVALALFGVGLTCSEIVAGAPLFWLAWELANRRDEWRRWTPALAASAMVLVVGAIMWASLKPHPHFFTYPSLPPGAFWTSIATTTAASDKHLGALLAGLWIPVRLIEVTRIIFSWADVKFIAWAIVNVVLAALTIRGIRRGKAWSLGAVLAFAAFLPFANIAWNRVEDFLSLGYLYLPAAGMALAMAAWVEKALDARSAGLRRGAALLCCTIAAFYGLRLVEINWQTRTELGHWARMARMAPDSATARMGLGVECLAREEDEIAFANLFRPDVKQLASASLAASMEYLDRGELLAALVHYRQIAEAGLGVKYSQRERAAARIYSAIGAPDYAEMSLGRCLQTNPRDTWAMAELARVWLVKGHGRMASRLCDECLAIDPADAAALRVRSLIAARRTAARVGGTIYAVRAPRREWLEYVIDARRGYGIRQEIIALGRRLTADPVIQVEAGLALAEEDEFEPALKLLGSVMGTFSLDSRMWDEVPQELYKRAGDERLAAACRRVISSDPTNALAVRTLAACLTAAGDTSEALEQLATAVKTLGDDYRTRTEFATALVRHGSYEEAVEEFSRLEAERPGDVVVLTNLAVALSRGGKREDAVAVYRKLVAALPDSPEALVDLADALSSQGDPAGAEPRYRRAAEMGLKTPRVLRGLGVALVRQGKAREGVAQLESALKLAPDDAITLRDLGLVRMMQGRIHEAVAVLRRSVALRLDPVTMKALAEALYLTGQIKEAGEWRLKASRTVAPTDEMRLRREAASKRHSAPVLAP